MHGAMSFVGFRRDQGIRSRTNDNSSETRSTGSALAQSKPCSKMHEFRFHPRPTQHAASRARFSRAEVLSPAPLTDGSGSTGDNRGNRGERAMRLAFQPS